MSSAEATHASAARARAKEIELAAHRKWELGELHSAFRLFLGAAKLGATYAQLDLAYFYDTGLGVKRNRTAAMHWYKRAYGKGNAPAASGIGTIYRDEGKLNRSIEWLKRAVKLGDIDSNLLIAEILIEKQGRFQEAVPYLRHVVGAKGGTEVTMATWEKANHYLTRDKRISGGRGAHPKLLKP